MRRKLARFLAATAGATAVEFAIVCPLIFSAVLGTFEAGRALYVRNHVSEACAAGARAAIMNGGATDDAIEEAVLAAFTEDQQDYAEVDIQDVTIGSGDFKKIEVVYEHDFIIKFGPGLSGITLTVTRYAPDVG